MNDEYWRSYGSVKYDKLKKQEPTVRLTEVKSSQKKHFEDDNTPHPGISESNQDLVKEFLKQLSGTQK